MNELNDDMKKMLAKQLPVQATSSPSGVPDIGPKRSLRLYDDRTLIYNENTGGQTLQNIREGSKMAVVVIDREALDVTASSAPRNCSWRASRLTTRWHLQKNGMKPPKYAVLIHIDSIYTLRSGPNAGTRL